MRFESPFFLLLFLLLVPLFIYALYRREPSIILPSLVPIRDISKQRGFLRKLKFRFPLLLETAAISLLIIALARPQKGLERFRHRTEGVDIMIVLDLSGSMSAIDIPKNLRGESLKRAIMSSDLKERIEIAKDEISAFISRRTNDRIGLVIFGPLPYLAVPPTIDHQWLIERLQNLRAGEVGDSTNIASGLASAIARLKESDAKRKVIVLFTDGKHNVESRISPLQAAALAKDNNIKIYSVGIGSPQAVVIFTDLFGRKQLQAVEFEFDEEILKEISSMTGGRYFPARDANELEETMKEIDKLEKTEFEAPVFVEYKELALPLIKISVAILLFAFIALNTVSLRIP